MYVCISVRVLLNVFVLAGAELVLTVQAVVWCENEIRLINLKSNAVLTRVEFGRTTLATDEVGLGSITIVIKQPVENENKEIKESKYATSPQVSTSPVELKELKSAPAQFNSAKEALAPSSSPSPSPSSSSSSSPSPPAWSWELQTSVPAIARMYPQIAARLAEEANRLARLPTSSAPVAERLETKREGVAVASPEHENTANVDRKAGQKVKFDSVIPVWNDDAHMVSVVCAVESSVARFDLINPKFVWMIEVPGAAAAGNGGNSIARARVAQSEDGFRVREPLPAIPPLHVAVDLR